MRLHPSASLFPLALLAAGSCGGASGGGPDSILVVGGAEGKVTDLLAAQYGLDQAPMGADLGSAKYILLDGDHVTPSMIRGMNGLKAATSDGTPIILVDANEDTKAAMADQLGAFGYPGGDSQATVFVKTESDDPSEYGVGEIPAGSNTLSKTAPGDLARPVPTAHKGEVKVPIVATPDMVKTVMDFARRRGALRSEGNSAGRPPLGVKKASVPFVVADGGANATLGKQPIGRALYYNFTVFLSEKIEGGYEQHLLVDVYGSLLLGDQVWNQAADSSHDGKVGWLQLSSALITSLPAADSLRAPLNATRQATQHQDGESYAVEDSFLVGYRNADKEYSSWAYYVQRPARYLTDWYQWEEGVYRDKSTTGSFSWQLRPFPGVDDSGLDSWWPNRPDTLPFATLKNIPVIDRPSRYLIPKAVRGRVAVNYSAWRQLAALDLGPNRGDGRTGISQAYVYDDTNRTFILDFAKHQVAPPASLESNDRP